MDSSLILISNDLGLSLIVLAVLEKSIYKMTSGLDHSHSYAKKREEEGGVGECMEYLIVGQH